MKREELKQAIKNNTLCECNGIKYYVCGASIMHMKGEQTYENVILHDLKANSITRAEYSQVKLLEDVIVKSV